MIIAKVNGESITDVDARLELSRLVHLHHRGFSLNEIKSALIQHLIDHKLINQLAIKENIDISSDDSEYNYLEFLLNFDTHENYQQFLSFHSFNEEQIRNYLTSIFRIKCFISKILSKELQSNEELISDVLNDFNDCLCDAESVRISHILIKRKDDFGKKKIFEIYQKIKSNEDFSNLAGECSECESKCLGGDMGFIRKGELLPEIDKIAFKMKINEISEPFESNYGYHVIMVTDKKTYEKKSIDDVKEAFIIRVCKLEAELKIVKFLRKIRQGANIEVFQSEIERLN